MNAPDLTEKVLGYRNFVLIAESTRHLRHFGLYEVSATYRWHPGVNIAECAPPGWQASPVHDEPAPQAQCRCGFHAFHDSFRTFKPNLVIPSPNLMYVAAAILAWGRIEAHVQGFRAQYAEILMLAHDTPERLPHDILDEYNVPVIHMAELADRATAFGRPIPQSLIPHAQPNATLAL